LLFLSHSGPHKGKYVSRLAGSYPVAFFRAGELTGAKEQAGLDSSDFVLIDGPLAKDWLTPADLFTARFIAIRDTASGINRSLVEQLANLENCIVHVANPMHEDGYAIVELRGSADPNPARPDSWRSQPSPAELVGADVGHREVSRNG
jgi:hypothetical protein